MGTVRAAMKAAASPWPIAVVYSALAVMSLATAGIHFAVTGEHLEEYTLFGLFFILIAWFEALWALGVVVSPTRTLLKVGLAVNGLTALIWLMSRTVGLPIGPEPWTPEQVQLLDALSTALELGIVAIAAALLLRSPSDPRDASTNTLPLVGALAIGLVLLTSIALASADPHQHGRGELTCLRPASTQSRWCYSQGAGWHAAKMNTRNGSATHQMKETTGHDQGSRDGR